jgi:hypothetical protein
MTETGNTVERLRLLVGHSEKFIDRECRGEVVARCADVRALLAVVEAAQEFWQEMVGVKLDAQQTFHFDDLGTKLATLHTQASDEEPGPWIPNVNTGTCDRYVGERVEGCMCAPGESCRAFDPPEVEYVVPFLRWHRHTEYHDPNNADCPFDASRWSSDESSDWCRCPLPPSATLDP